MRFFNEECLHEALKNVLATTENGNLDDPSWVNEYFSQQINVCRCIGLIPEEKWKETRLQVLEMIVPAFV